MTQEARTQEQWEMHGGSSSSLQMKEALLQQHEHCHQFMSVDGEGCSLIICDPCPSWSIDQGFVKVACLHEPLPDHSGAYVTC